MLSDFLTKVHHSLGKSIADNLSKAGWSWGCVSALGAHGRTIWIADAHGYGKRFVVRADEIVTAVWCLLCEILLLMTTKLLALMSAIALATLCGVQAQSPTPGESPTASPSPPEKTASPSPAESPTASPKGKPTPKKAKIERKARPVARPAGPTTEKATNPQAPGGGPGLVWVNTEAGVYHGERSPFYGTTGKGKYMTEQDAIRAGYKRAPQGR